MVAPPTYFLVTVVLFVAGIELCKLQNGRGIVGNVRIYFAGSPDQKKMYYSAWERMAIWFIGILLEAHALGCFVYM